MWKKYFVIFILLYLFALMQTSFFAHFSLWGAVPDLVFILFFVIAFFEPQRKIIPVIFTGACAGFFLDIFYFPFLGPSVASLILLGILLKGLQNMLKMREDGYPLLYFIPLSLTFIIGYNLLLGMYLRFSGSPLAGNVFSFKTILALIYDCVFAIIFFYVYKKIVGFRENSRQMKLL